jgi:hypothetical protein
MARIELRDVTIYLEDGFSGTAVIEEATPTDADLDMDVNTVNTTNTTAEIAVVGGRFTVNTANSTTIYTITGTTETANETTNIEFTPALATANQIPAVSDVITFLPQRLEVKIGEGNLTYSEKKEYEYLRDRGNLDTVKEGDEQPVEVSLEFVYEYLRSSSGGDITPVDALKQIGEASDWISSSSDLCEPYAIDMRAKHCVPCGTDEDEDVLLQDFRWESLDYDLQSATIAVAGKCNVSDATVTRSTDTEC